MTYRRKHINPKIKGLKAKKIIIKRPIFWILLAFILFFSALNFLLFFPGLQVLKINISGNEKVQSKDIENMAWDDINTKIIAIGGFQISTKSIFIADVKKITDDMMNKFPDIESIELQKKMPQDINLVIKERKAYAALCQLYLQNANEQNNIDKCFLVDGNGIVFEKLESIPQNTIIITQVPDNNHILIGKNAIPKNEIDMISKIQKSLKNNFQIGIKEVSISNTMIFTTDENWQIYFDKNSDIDMQIIKMNVLLKDEIPVNIRKNLQYIYLQYKDRAYYK